MKPTTICIGIPCGDIIRSKFLITLIGSIFSAPCPVHVVIREGVYVPENRLYIVREAQARKCSHLWLLDNDMYFPDDVLLKLVAQDRDIIGAAYNMRKLPLTTTVKFADEHGTLIAKDAKDIPVVPFTCHSVGFGCTLINMQVFEKIEQPWFYCAHNAAGEMETGDDVWFCRQAAKAGYDIWADPTLGVKHIGDFAY